MKNIYFILFFFIYSSIYSQFNYTRDWGTYYGGNGTKTTDGIIDSQGNVYITGDVYGSIPYSNNFVTANAHQPNYGGGNTDTFIAKYNPDGILLWSTYFGGSGDENIYSLALDNFDNLYIAGQTTSTTNIATSTAFQTTPGANGSAYIAKFSPTGILQWSTYYLTNTRIMDISCDNERNIILCGYTTNLTGITTVASFQENYTGTAPVISYLTKFNESGQKVWSTYYSPNTSSVSLVDAICINSSGIFIKGSTDDTTGYYATEGCHQPQNNGQTDLFLSKFGFNGERLWSTYYGGEAGDQFGLATSNQKSISCNENNIYLSGVTASTTSITTPGSFQESSEGFSLFLIQFNNSGIRQWGTYTGTNLGSTSSDSSISTDTSNNSYISGRTSTKNNISTSGTYQEQIAGSTNPNNGELADYSDAFVIKFSPLGQKLWGTYYGGESTELSGSYLTNGDSFYLYGTTQSTQGIATSESQQPAFDAGTVSFSDAGNAYIAKFSEIALNNNYNQIQNLALYPNPNNGNFSLRGDLNGLKDLSLAVYDCQGRIVFTKKVEQLQNDNLSVQLQNKLSSGVYLVKLYNPDLTKSFKIIVN